MGHLRKFKTLFWGCFGCLLVLGGVAVAIKCTYDYTKMIRARKYWLSTEGVITKANIIQLDSGFSSHKYIPEIEYSYSVNGQVLTGDRVRIGEGKIVKSRDKAAARISEYKVGNNITVFYNGDSPSDSVLKLDWVDQNHLLNLGGILLITINGIQVARKYFRQLATENQDKRFVQGDKHKTSRVKDGKLP
jgi:hypothetical protein